MNTTRKKKISLIKFLLPIFVLFMLLALKLRGQDAIYYISLTLKRVVMLLILMVAATPTIYTGVGINYGVTIGFVCGLGGAVIGISSGLTGLPLMLVCILTSVPISIVVGFLYGKILVKATGSENLIATYMGFSFVALASIVWILLNPSNEALHFSNGAGIRVQVNLDGLFKDLLTNFWSIQVGSLTIPLGFLLICFVIMAAYALFMKSKIGTCMKICGYNPVYAKSIGINVEKYKIVSVIVSTILASVGICFYAQTWGYYEFYSSYMNLGFTCIAGILIGGGSDKNVTMPQVFLGCVLYEAILTLSTPLANELISTGSLPEIIRLVVTNGVILYALTKRGGNDE